ncbi:hypothetical protein [Chroococcidiopsis sp.]|uniref:hypothetical protein n=1 Tax=Chroococcidiopsis sp. TaxID=3088168 RepID=UPI003F2BCDE7
MKLRTIDSGTGGFSKRDALDGSNLHSKPAPTITNSGTGGFSKRDALDGSNLHSKPAPTITDNC